MSKRGNPNKVNPALARMALINAKGDKKKAYSECIRLNYKLYGTLDCGFTNADLQAFYVRGRY